MIDEDAIVTLHYTIKFKDGKIFDSTRYRDPVTFKMANNEMPPGFEETLMGMDVAQTKNAELPPNKLFGPPDPELVAVIPIDQVPKHITPEVGQRISITDEDKKTTMVSVVKVENGEVTLDANPPQVGDPFVLSVEVIDIDYA